MSHALNMMQEYYDADYVSLHVRVKNRPAIILYHNNLGFNASDIEKEYYHDKEDAYKMRKYFKSDKKDPKKIDIKISDEINYEEIKFVFEEVDAEGQQIRKQENKEEPKQNNEKEEIKDNNE